MSTPTLTHPGLPHDRAGAGSPKSDAQEASGAEPELSACRDDPSLCLQLTEAAEVAGVTRHRPGLRTCSCQVVHDGPCSPSRIEAPEGAKPQEYSFTLASGAVVIVSGVITEAEGKAIGPACAAFGNACLLATATLPRRLPPNLADDLEENALHIHSTTSL